MLKPVLHIVISGLYKVKLYAEIEVRIISQIYLILKAEHSEICFIVSPVRISEPNNQSVWRHGGNFLL
jgi:hypothetical protein